MGKEKQKKEKVNAGFGLRLSIVLILWLIGIVLIIVGIGHLQNEIQESEIRNEVQKLGIIIISAGALSVIIGVLQLIAAIKGRTKIWANTLSIVIGSVLCVAIIGIPALVGGVKGKKALIKLQSPVSNSDAQTNQSINGREKVKGAGFGLRLSFAIILLISAVYCLLINILTGVSGGILIIMIGVSAFLAVCGILQLIAAIKGRTKKWADTMSIVIGAPFCLAVLGVLAVVGGVKGKRALLKAEASANEANCQPVETAEDAEAKPLDIGNEATAESAETETAGNATEPVAIQEPLEYIQPKLSPKAKKGMFIAVIVSYTLLLIAGILFVAVPAIGKLFSGMGICEEISARAYAVTVGTMWLALLPTIGYYVAFVSPIELSKTKKIIIAVISGVLSIALCAVFFVVINSVKIDGFAVKEYYENDDKWFIPVSMVFVVIGIALCYALTFFRLNPTKIKTAKPEECGEGLFAVIKHVFACLIYGIMKLAQAILTFKEKQPEIFLFVATFLFTWLVYFTSFVFSIIMIAVFVGVICMCFFGTIHIMYSPSVGRVTAKQITVDGKVLTKNDNIAGNGYSEVYTDEYGNVYYSNDGGRSVIGSVDRSIAENEAELAQIRAAEAERQRRGEEEAEELRRLNELNNNQNH